MTRGDTGADGPRLSGPITNWGWPRGFAGARRPHGPACVILTAPNVGVNTSVQRMRELYEAVGINVQLASTENLNLPDLNDVDVGKCQMGTTTDEQDDLFANRNNANADDICAYFVRSTVPPFNGCAAHPDNRPALVVALRATQWTLAHEAGHAESGARGRQRPADDQERATSPTRLPTLSPTRSRRCWPATTPGISRRFSCRCRWTMSVRSWTWTNPTTPPPPGSEEALPHLERLVRGDDPMLASKATYAASLIEGGSDVVEAATRSDAVVRVAAAAAVRNLPSGRARRMLRQLSDDDDPGIRKVARASGVSCLLARRVPASLG